MNNPIKSNPREQTLKALFVGKCWSYLNDNFHKFDKANKIKIALELCKKDIPQEIEGEFTHNFVEMPVIRRGGQPLEYHIGSN